MGELRRSIVEMVGTRADGSASADRLDVRSRWFAMTVGILAVLVIGAVGTVAAVMDEQDRAADRDHQAATVAAAAIGDNLKQSTSALSGIDGLAADGGVSDDEFRTFASKVYATNIGMQALARDEVVSDADRAAFERRTGRPITQASAAGGFVPASQRPTYIVVTDVVPRTEATEATLGFDLASDQIRETTAQLAATTGSARLSEPVELAATGRPGFFLIQPIFGPESTGRDLIGFVSAGLVAEVLLAAARELLPPGSEVALHDAATGTGGAPGATVTLDAGGRTWAVTADDPTGPNWALPAVVGTATLLLVLLLVLLAAREARFDRAQVALTRQLERDAERTHRLADVARRLSAVEHLDDVVRVIEEAIPAVVGADVADVGLLLDEEYLGMLGGRHGFDPELTDRYRRVPLKVHLPTTAAIGEARVVLVDDLVEYQRDQPELLADAVAAQLRSVAAAPLLNAAGDVTGVLALAWRRPITFDPGMAPVIRTLADACGQTLERARVADRRHAFIGALQRRLLPRPPTVDGLRIVARYRPAGMAVGMGGDWYQFLPLSDGSLLLVIGDVVGHGVEAVATMTQIQHVIAAAIHNGLALEVIFEHLRSALDDGEAAQATAQLLHVDQRRDRIGYVSAGHPYAIVRGPDGATTVLDGAQHPMVGLPVAMTPLANVPFPPGSLLLAYTDGLIERRSRPITAGIESLRRRLAQLEADDISAALDRLIDDALSVADDEERVDDDVAVVLIRRAGPARPSVTAVAP